MAENVTRIRLVDSGEQDRYGKPVYTQSTSQQVAHVFAPVVVDDTRGLDSVTAVDGGTLYFRHPNMVDAEPDDRWVIRGDEYQSEGREAVWRNSANIPIGTVVVVRRTTFTTD
ncbi:hypothetical protein P5G50_18345 [Leifsonia sp. F6_8S_P_1B]|uniref:Head-to-tail stopper n=1 Tax=Leifsonia williamsii TaxID=3035919 RepID=A0ABT8KIW1_9MICO|nr:hypothetical protein [Leifsonia williamsii]MDN4616412.1 hypothetical protein [Leifsonia williamsii]